MDSLDPKVASLASRLVDSNRRDHGYEEDDDEAIFAELEAEIENDTNSSIREQGLSIIKQEVERVRRMQESNHGTYSEIMDEKEVIRTSANEPRCVIHFYHTNFKRCEIMDQHLARLAPKYFSTRFIRVFVENVPWLVEKLSIKVLPCVIMFVDGVTKDRLVGFEELGNVDTFETAALELRLLQSGVIQKPVKDALGSQITYNLNSSSTSRTRLRGQTGGDDDDVFDLD